MTIDQMYTVQYMPKQVDKVVNFLKNKLRMSAKFYLNVAKFVGC